MAGGYEGWQMPTDSWSNDISGARAAQALFAGSGFANQFDPAGINAIGSALGGQGTALMLKAMQDQVNQMDAARMQNALGYAQNRARMLEAQGAQQADLRKLLMQQQFEQSMFPQRTEAELAKQRLANEGPLAVERLRGQTQLSAIPMEMQGRMGMQQLANQGQMERQQLANQGQMELQPLKNEGQTQAMIAAHGAQKPDMQTLAMLMQTARDNRVPKDQQLVWAINAYKQIQNVNPQTSGQGMAPPVNAPMSPGVIPRSQQPSMGVSATSPMSFLERLRDLYGLNQSSIPDYSGGMMPGSGATEDYFRRNL